MTTKADDETLRLAAADMMLRIEEARESPFGLFKLMFADPKGRPAKIAEFYPEWNRLFLEERLFLISAARGLSKTTFLLFAVAWAIGRNPNIRVRWISADTNTAVKRLAVLHSILDAPIYNLVFPGLRKLTPAESKDEKRPNSATMLNVKRSFRSPEPTVEASGILTSGTGGRADLLAVDDPVSESNALLNPSMRPKVISKFLSDWMAILVPDGWVWYIGSPWHREDLLAYLKRKAGWKFVEHAHGKPGDPYHTIFPALWPRSVLKQRRIDYGPLHYARAYLCQPFTDETVAVKPSSLLHYHAGHLTEYRLYNSTTAVISLDPSSGKKLQSGKLDYTGVTVFLVWKPTEEDPGEDLGRPQFHVYVPASFQVKLPHVYQAKLAWQLARQWDAGHITIEAEGMQNLHSWLENERLNDPTLPLAEIHPTISHGLNKGQRLVRVSPLIELPEGQAPLVRFSPQALQRDPQPFAIRVGDPKGGYTGFEALADLYAQVTGFPTEHDDILDSFTGGLHWIHANLIGLPGSDRRRSSGPAIRAIAI